MSKKITLKEVSHVADLARVSLTKDELAAFTSELEEVLAYVDKIEQVDTKGVEPLASPTALTNQWREDQAASRDEEQSEKILQQAPDRYQNFIKVKNVLNN